MSFRTSSGLEVQQPIGPEWILFGANAVSSTTTTRYLFPSYVDNLAPLLANIIQYVIPVPCTLSRLYVHHNQPAGNGNNIVYTVRRNNVAGPLSVSIPSTTVGASDLVNSMVFAQGDIIDIEVTKALSIGATPNNIICSLRVTP